MNRIVRTRSVSKVFFCCCYLLLAFSLSHAETIDHNHTDITRIPQSAIEQAKAKLHIVYGHTSHGSQLMSGMSGLVDFANGGGLGLSLPHDIFEWNNGGTDGALDLHDRGMGGDVGYYPQWVNNTRTYLDNPANADVNVVIWSWCGQVSGKYSSGTLDSQYLTPMSQLETDYPNVTFVYMTGHVDIWDDADNKGANNMIRDYCAANNKVLYDFADIERYDPDGNYFEFVNDDCSYYDRVGGTRIGNWATEWQTSHTEGVDWYSCGSAHSQPLNANRKAYAAWWLWARLAGWGDCVTAPSELSAQGNPQTRQAELSWTHDAQGTNADSFIIQRRIDNGDWTDNYQSVPGNTTTFTDSNLSAGTYQYRVVAHRNDDGNGNPCDSAASNIASVQIGTTTPSPPSGLAVE